MKLNQKGFGVVEGLLIVIALILIMGVGFYVVNANKNKESNMDTTSQTTKEEVRPAEKASYLEVKELGLKVPLTDGIKNITYKLSDGSTDQAKVYSFYDTELAKRVNACRQGGEKTTDYRVYEVFKGDGQFNPNREAASTAQLLKQFDAFYIAYIGQPNFSPCTDKDGVSVENEQITSDIEKVQNNLANEFAKAEKL